MTFCYIGLSQARLSCLAPIDVASILARYSTVDADVTVSRGIRTSGEACLARGVLYFDQLDRTWHYPPACAGLEKFTYSTARDLLVSSSSSVLFVGNSVSRRLLYAVAHIIGGPNATSKSNVHADEKVIDVHTHGTFEVEVSSSGHCSKQRTCAISPFAVHEGAIGLNVSVISGLNCPMKAAWDMIRSRHAAPCAHLGSIFTGTPVVASTQALINAWSELAQGDRPEFQASPADNYDVLVIQITIFTEADVRALKGLLSDLRHLVEVRKRRNPLKVVFWGSPFTDEKYATLDTVSIKQKLHTFLSKERLAWLGEHVILVDVTNSTAEALLRRNLGHLTEHSGQHFGDFTRLMLADNILNAIKLLYRH